MQEDSPWQRPQTLLYSRRREEEQEDGKVSNEGAVGGIMTLVNGTWYDNEKQYRYGDHKFTLLPNSDGTPIMKCSQCKVSRMYLSLMNMTACKPKGGNG